MAYSRNPTWHDFPAVDTPITAAKLENIENGIVAAAATADSASSGLASKVDTGDSRLSDARTPLAHTHPESEITGLVADLAAKALNTVTVSAGTGLTGGGDLTANRTLSVDFAGAGVTTAGKVVNANDARLSDARTPLAHNHAGAEITSGTVAYARLPIGTAASTVAAGDDSRITGAAQKSANLSDLTSAATARTNLSLGGAAVLNVGTIGGTVAAGNDTRFTDPQYDVNTVGTSGTTQTLAASSAAHKITLSANCTFTFSSPTKVGHTFVLYLSGAFTPTFPASVKWDGGAAPTYTSPALYTFTTVDSGTTWIGAQVAKAIA